MTRLLVILSVLLAGSIGLSQAPTPITVEPGVTVLPGSSPGDMITNTDITTDQALTAFKVLTEAVQNGQYLLAAAALTLIMVVLFRKLLMPRLGLKAGVLPLVSAILGCLTGGSLAILAGANAQQATMAVLAGPLASTLWDALAKYFFKK